MRKVLPYLFLILSDPRYVRIELYLIQDTMMKEYDKSGKLGEVRR